MKRKLLILLMLSTSIFGCIDSNNLKPVIPEHLINANSAKTWVEVAYLKNDVDLAPAFAEIKRTFTFFENGTFREQQLIHLGSENGKYGKYNVHILTEKDTTFSIFYDNGNQLDFKLGYIDTKILKLSNDSLKWIFQTLTPPTVE